MMLKALFKELLYTCGTLSESIFIVMFVFGQPGLVAKECKEAVQRYKIFKMMPLCLCACLCVCN
jgi:hypothetical protein